MSETGREPESIAHRTARGAGWIIAWRLATRNIGLINTLILVRLLQPEDFGLVAIASGFIMAADALSWIGVHDAVIREPKPDRALYDSAFTLSLLRGLLSGLVILALAWPIASFFNEDRLVWVLIALAGGMVISAGENIGIVDFRRDMHFHKEFQLQVWSRLVGVAVTITAAFVWQTYWALVAGVLAGRVIRLGQSYVMSPYRPGLTLVAWRRLIGFSLWSWATTVLIQVRDRTDHLIIGRMLDTKAVGGYAVGYEIGTLTTTELSEPLNRALFSGFANIQNEAERRTSLYLGAIGLSVAIVFPCGVGISLIAHPLVHLMLGPQWLHVIGLVQVVAVGSTLSVMSYIGNAFLMANGAIRYACLTLAISAVIRFPVMIACVWQWGLVGAGIAAALSVFIDQCVGLHFVLPRIHVRLLQVLERMWRPAAACLAMAGGLHLCGMAWQPPNDVSIIGLILDAGFRAATGAAIYGSVLLLLWLAAGRPAGAEQQIMTLARDRLRRR